MQHTCFLDGYHAIAFSPLLPRLWIERKRTGAFRPLDRTNRLKDILLDFFPYVCRRKSPLVNQSLYLHNFHPVILLFLTLGVHLRPVRLRTPAHGPELEGLGIKRSAP